MDKFIGTDTPLAQVAQVAQIQLAVLLTLAAAIYAQGFLMPATAAIVCGLALSPVARFLEHRGANSIISASLATLLFIALLMAGFALFALPVWGWLERLPEIWQRLESHVLSWQGMMAEVDKVQHQITEIMDSSENMVVSVDQPAPLNQVAGIAPQIGAQIGLFLVGLFLFLVNREDLRVAIVRLFAGRKLRWRVAHLFRAVERNVSRYLLTIALINAGVGLSVTLLFFIFGIPSPILWGGMAFFANFMPFVGQFVMMILLLAEGLTTQNQLLIAAIPLGLFLIVSFLESQIVTPMLIGRVMVINPFLIFLAVALGIWLWGPMGGFLALPLLVASRATVDTLMGVKPRLAKQTVNSPKVAADSK